MLGGEILNMKRREALQLLGGLVAFFLFPDRAEAKAKPLPKDISGTYRGRFGDHSTCVVRVVQRNGRASYSYRFRNNKTKRKFSGSGTVRLNGTSMVKKGVGVVLNGKRLHLTLRGGQQITLKR